jgi:hypothetical protein
VSGVEALVVVLGLFVGYWAVAKLIANQPTWHQTLNVSPQASAEEIEASYRLLKSQYQPDDKSKEIEAAYRRALAARGRG